MWNYSSICKNYSSIENNVLVQKLMGIIQSSTSTISIRLTINDCLISYLSYQIINYKALS